MSDIAELYAETLRAVRRIVAKVSTLEQLAAPLAWHEPEDAPPLCFDGTYVTIGAVPEDLQIFAGPTTDETELFVKIGHPNELYLSAMPDVGDEECPMKIRVVCIVPLGIFEQAAAQDPESAAEESRDIFDLLIQFAEEHRELWSKETFP